MITTSLYPSAATFNSGVTSVDPGGPGGYSAPLGDIDFFGLSVDTTYDEFDAAGGSLVLDLDNYTIPAGDMIKSMRGVFRFRTIDVGGSEKIIVNLNDGVNPAYNVWTAQNFAQTSPTRDQAGPFVLGTPDGLAMSQTLINAMKLAITTDLPAAGGSTTRVRFYEARVDLVVLSPPSVSGLAPTGTTKNPSPQLTWIFNGDSGEPQTWFRVKVFNDSDASVGGFDPETSTLALYDSGDVASATAARTPDVEFGNGTYRFYVKAAQIRKHWSAWAYTPIVIEQGPAIPALTPPTGIVLDTNSGFTAGWTYVHPSGILEASWALRRATDGGAYQWWNNGGSAWQGTEIYNTGAVTSKAFAATTWPNGHDYAWAVSVKDAMAVASDYASDSTIHAVAPPVAAIIGPAGTITTTSRPAITWSYSDGAFRGQDGYQAKIFLASIVAGGGFDPETSSAVYDSGVVAGNATSQPLNLDLLTNSTNYVAYVKVLAGGTQWSAWDDSSFHITVTPPTAPALTAVEYTPTNAVTLTATGVSEAGYASVTHYYEHLVRGIWQPVRFATALVPNGSFVTTVKDNEVPSQVSISFRVKVLGVLAGGGIVASAFSTIATCTLHPTSWWIKDVVGQTYVAVAMDETFKPKQKLTAGSFPPVGQTTSVVISEPAFRGIETPMGLWIKNLTQLTAVKGVLQPGVTLLVLDVLNNMYYVRLSGDLDTEPLMSGHPTLPREYAYRWEVPITEVDRPGVS